MTLGAGTLLGPGGRSLTAEQSDAVRRRDGLAAAGGQRRQRQDLRARRALRALGAGGRRARRRASWRSRSPSGPPASCARACASASSSSAAATRRARPRRPGCRRSTGSAPGCCARMRSRPGWTRPSRSSTRPPPGRCATAPGTRRSRACSAEPAAAAALDLVAAYDADRLRTAIAGVHDALRSAGQTRPRLPRPRGLADPQRRARRCRPPAPRRPPSLRAPATGRSSGPRASAWSAAPSCSRAAAPGEPAAALGEMTLGAERQRAEDAGLRRATAPRSTPTRRPAATRARPPRWRCSTSCSATTPTPTPTPSARARRWTSTISSCTRATCSTPDPALRDSYAERFERVMVDEFQDTNPLQLELLGALDRDDLFLVGDELQSIYGFRHADVDVFRRLRASSRRAAGSRRSRRTSARTARSSTRSTPPSPARCGAGFVALRAGRDDRSRAGEPLVELLITDAGRLGGGRARRGAPAARRPGARPRRAWSPSACASSSTPACTGRRTSSCSCARSATCRSSSARSRTRAC